MRATGALLMVLLASPALAQKDALFGSGKPVVTREEDLDRRFAKTKLARGLGNGTEDEHCAQLLLAMLTVLAEAGPTLHARDESFTVDPGLLAALESQVSSGRFPAAAYVAAMVRRVLIDRKLPDEWFAVAEALKARAAAEGRADALDLGKLRFLNEGLRPIDSMYFTLPLLRERYELEVKRANSAVVDDVAREFRDAYLDREVAWGGLTFLDAGVAKKDKSRKKRLAKDEDPDTVIAILEWDPPQPNQHQLMVYATPKVPPVMVYAKLAPQQFLDITRLPRGSRMLVRGRFWEMNRSVTEVEVRNALLFKDPIWPRGFMLANPEAVNRCPYSVNDLTGTAPRQPGGFSH